ncbi:RNA-directed DNA polymerase, eukaryota [Tanacetum coccineum]
MMMTEQEVQGERESESGFKVVKLASLRNFCTRKAGRRSTTNPSSAEYCSLRVCWEKFARYFEVEVKEVKFSEGYYVTDPKNAVEMVDENILGSTVNGEFEDIHSLHKDLSTILRKEAIRSKGFVVVFRSPFSFYPILTPSASILTKEDLVKVHSNADLTRTISKSIFVTNFPDNTTSADLWNICQTYGVVVDVYIPNRRSKVGKRFAFVRFIKVTNVERLVGNLCTLWIGRMHLHANVVRFERTPFQQSQPPPPTRPGKIAPSFVSAVKGILPTPVLSPPAMVLDDSCMVTTDLRNYVMGEVKLFSSVNNLRVILSAEGFSIQKVVYLGGLWVMFELPSANSKSKFLAHVGVGSWFKSLSNPQPDFSPRDRIIWVDVEGVPMHAWSSNTFHKIGSMWGEVLELGDCKDECFARKRLCIKTNRDDNILEKFKIIVKGKSFVIRAKELFVWSPSFVKVTEADDIHDDQFSTDMLILRIFPNNIHY